MRALENKRQTSSTHKSDKDLAAHFTRTRKACTAIQADLDRISAHGTIPKTEITELSKRVKALDNTASIFLSSSR
jgi:hypothetical protein